MKKVSMGLALLLGISLSSRAQTEFNADVSAVEASAPIAAQDLPPAGNFYSARNISAPPSPGNFNFLPAWDLGQGNYLLDDLDFQPQSHVGMRTMDDGPPPPVFTNTGGGGGVSGGITNLPNFGTNLCLLIAQVPNAVVVTFSNTVAGSNYLLLAATNVNGPWLTNQSLLASSTVTVAAPFWSSGTTASFFLGVQAAPPPPGTLKWSVFLGGDGDNLVSAGIDASPAIAADGTIYIRPTCTDTSTSNLLYAIDPVSGNVKWTNNIFTNDAASSNPGGCEISSSPAIGADETIYVGSEDGRLYAVGSNGITSWSVDLGVSVFSSPAIGADGAIYVGTDDSYTSSNAGFWAITNDAVKWFFEPQDLYYGNAGDVDSSPAIGADGTLYFLAEGARLYAVSSNGNLKWFLPVGGHEEPDSSPAIGPDGTIYVGSASNYLYAVYPDGSLKWVFNLASAVPGSSVPQGSPTIGPDGTIYATAIGNYPAWSLSALNPDGTQKWAYTNDDGAARCAPAIGSDGTVYFGSVDQGFYAVTNGSLAWSYTTGGEIYSSASIAADGTVYVGSGDGYLYAFFGSSPPATNAPWPMFHQNPAHTGRQSPPTAAAADCAAPFVYHDSGDGMADFTFHIVGTPNSVWNVYASTNLTNWTQVGANLALVTNVDSFNGNAYFQDTAAAELPQGFYQLSNNGCCSRVIGFVNLNIVPGTNLIADQLYQVDDWVLHYSPDFFPLNTLNSLFPPLAGFDQLGTQIIKWNGQGFDVFTFGYNTAYRGAAWSDTNGLFNGDATLLPGIGVLMNNGTGSSFTASFVGLVRQEQVFQIQAGTNYLSATLPVAGAITNITGYVPHHGDVIQLWNTNSQIFQSYTNNGSAWSPGSPVVGAGEGFVLITTNANTWTNTWQY